jgi:hypothetical protein
MSWTICEYVRVPDQKKFLCLRPIEETVIDMSIVVLDVGSVSPCNNK